MKNTKKTFHEGKTLHPFVHMQQMKKEFYVVKTNLNSWFHMYSSWIHHSLHPWKRHCFSYEDPNQNYVEMTKFPRLLKSFLKIGIFLCAIILNHVSFRKCIWLKKLWPFSYNHHWKLSNVMSCHVLQSNMISSSNHVMDGWETFWHSMPQLFKQP